MIITEQLQKHWEKGKHHSAAMESFSDWSEHPLRWLGNQQGLREPRHFAIKNLDVLSALMAGTRLEVQSICSAPSPEAGCSLSTENI